jgi:hypothetical protein
MNVIPFGIRDPNRLPHPKRQEITSALDNATPLFGSFLCRLLPELRQNRPLEDILLEFQFDEDFLAARANFEQSPTSMLEAMYGLRYMMYRGKIVQVSALLEQELRNNLLPNKPARELQLDAGENCCYLHFDQAAGQPVLLPPPTDSALHLPLEGAYIVQHRHHNEDYREIHLLMVSSAEGQEDCRHGHSLEFWVRFNQPGVLVRDRLESLFRGREHFIEPVTHIFKAFFALSTAPRQDINEFDQVDASAKAHRTARLDGSYNRTVIGHV